MPVINPAIQPTTDPNYLGYSRGISTPESNKTAIYAGQAEAYKGEAAKHLGEAKGYEGQAEASRSQGLGQLFSGLGDIIQSSAKVADQYIKAQIDASAYSTVDAQTTKYRDAIKAHIDNLPQNVPSVAPVARPDDITINDTTSATDFSGQRRGPVAAVPAEVQDSVDRAETLVNARRNGKALSHSAYLANLNAELKSIRSRYPGHREYIDQRFSQITGMNVANAEIRSLSQDYAASVQALNAGQNKLETKILSHTDDVPGLHDDYLMWKQGKMDDRTILGKINEWVSYKSKLDAWKAYREFNKGTIEENHQRAVQDLSEMSGMHVNTMFNSVINRLPKGVWERVQRGEQIDPTLGNQVAETLRGARDGAFQSIYADAVKIGLHRSNYLGAQNLTNEINAQLAPFDNAIDRLTKGDTSAIGSVARQTASIIDVTANKQLTAPGSLGVYNREIAAARKNGGDFFQQKIIEATVGKGLLQDTEAYLERQITGLAVTPDPNTSRTPKAIIDGAQRNGVAIPEFNKAVVDSYDLVLDAKVGDKAKLSMIYGLVSGKNAGFISKFSEDRWNTSNGLYKNGAEWITGKYDTFSKLTRPTFASEVKRISERHDPTLFPTYVDWVKTTFSKELFPREIRNLSTIVETKGLQLNWDPDGKRFWLDRDPRVTDRLDPSSIVNRKAYFDPMIRRLNQGISALVNVGKVAGAESIDGDILTLLDLNGVNFRGSDIPAQMGRAIISGRTGAEEKPGGGVMKFTDEQLPSSGSLSGFLANPTGSFSRSRATNPPAVRNNAPATRGGTPRGNLSDSEILGIQNIEVPEGADLNEVLRNLKGR